jgi:circadian clock protein KaiC
MNDTRPVAHPPRSSTGIPGLDAILGGGFTPNRLYLIQGDPGAGKTTLGLQYLLEGVRQGEHGLYVTLSETEEELRAVAASHGWSLEGIALFELGPTEEALDQDMQYTMYHSSEVEFGETTRAVLDKVEQVAPSRVVFDSLSEMRLLAQNPLRYRRQILALKQFFTGRQCTVLMLDDRTSEVTDLQLQSIAHGVLTLEQLAPEYGGERRRLSVLKMRGQTYGSGYHDFRIVPGGLEIYPRLVAVGQHAPFTPELLLSGVATLDALLGGGLDRGTSLLLMGTAGAGKSSVAVQYAVAAAARGEATTIFVFDERPATLLVRAAGLGMPIQEHLNSGLIQLQQVNPTELSPGEFMYRVQQTVAHNRTKVVIIDSLNGYLNAMPGERFLLIQLHELLTFLSQQRVTTLLVLAQQGIVGQPTQVPVDISYLADTVLLLRTYELAGELQRAISVVKKRTGKHDRMIRQLGMTNSGITIGEPLRQLQGVLSGIPSIIGPTIMTAGHEGE